MTLNEVNLHRLSMMLDPPADGESAIRLRTATVVTAAPLVIDLGGAQVPADVLNSIPLSADDNVVAVTRTNAPPLVLGTAGVLAGGWVDAAPVLRASGTNPALGTGGQLREGRYLRSNGGLVTFRFSIRWGDQGGATAGAGNYFIDPPTAIAPSYALNANAVDNIIGTVWGFDQSANHWEPFRWQADGSMRSSAGIVHAGSPWTWGAADRLQATVTYEPTEV